MTSDTERSRTFYFALSLDGRGTRRGVRGYSTFTKDGVNVAGCMAKVAQASGGQDLVEATPVGDLGTMAVIADPGGAVVGLWRSVDRWESIWGHYDLTEEAAREDFTTR
jgi:hypothetical protein